MITINGTLPQWVSYDADNNRLVAAAGSFCGQTQSQADASAQSSLDNFVASALQSGLITCTPTTILVVGSCFAIVSGQEYLIFNSPNSTIQIHIGTGAPVVNSVTVSGAGFSLLVKDEGDNTVTPPLSFPGGIYYKIVLTCPPGSGHAGVLTILSTGSNSPFIVNLLTQ